MLDQTFEQNSVFFKILPYLSGEEQQPAGETIEYPRHTGNRNVLYSLSMRPEVFPVMKKAFSLSSARGNL